MAGVNTRQERKDSRFRPGESGNPAGKPRGARNKATLAIEKLMEGEAEALGRRVVELALSGDTVALRLCLERIAPVRKGRAVSLDIGPVETTADLAKAQARVIEAMGAGEITTDEAADAAKVIEHVGNAMERRDLEARIAALEAKKGR